MGTTTIMIILFSNLVSTNMKAFCSTVVRSMRRDKILFVAIAVMYPNTKVKKPAMTPWIQSRFHNLRSSSTKYKYQVTRYFSFDLLAHTLTNSHKICVYIQELHLEITSLKKKKKISTRWERVWSKSIIPK